MGDLDPNEDYNLNAVDGSQINLRDLFDVIATGRLSVLGLASAISTVVNTAISGIAGLLPAGGAEGQTLVKNSATNYDFSWTAASGGSGLLASMSYSGSAPSTSSTTAVDLDATNLKITFTVPASGTVLVKLSGPIYNDAALLLRWGVRNGATTVAENVGPGISGAVVAGAVTLRITGLTPGASLTYKWSARVNNSQTTLNCIYGTAVMEVWSA